VWVCGTALTLATTVCVALDAVTGEVRKSMKFDWHSIFALFQNSGTIIGGRAYENELIHSDVATCTMLPAGLTCDVKSFADADFLAGVYLPFPSKVLFIGQYNTYTSGTILTTSTNSVLTYVYTLNNMKSVVLSQLHSPPYFVGGFVAGTCLRGVGPPAVLIVAGMLRTDTGSLGAMVLSPVSNVFVSASELVNAMTMEYKRPDSFVAGGMLLDDDAGMHAYVIRVNALFYTVQYCVRYRSGGGGGRRALAGEPLSRSVMRGVVHVDDALFVVVDYTTYTTYNASSVVVMQLDAGSGVILKQICLGAPNSSFSCNSIAITGDLFAVVCRKSPNSSVVINFDRELTFSALPKGVVRMGNGFLRSEPVQMQRSVLSVTSTKANVAMSTYTFSADGDRAPTRKPTVAPSPVSTTPPSSNPSSQPSSSPTTVPTLSARPTSQPSSASPSTSHKPSTAPTPAPSVLPSTLPTPAPSQKPTSKPTTPPTVRPSTAPTVHPSVLPSQRPTRSSSARPTRSPGLTAPSATVSPSSVPTDIIAPDDSHRGGLPSFVVGASIGSGLGVLVIGYALYKYMQRRDELQGRVRRMKVYFTEQAALVESARRAREAELARDAARAADRTAERAARRIERNERMAGVAERRNVGAYMNAPQQQAEERALMSASARSSVSTPSVVISSLRSSDNESSMYSAHSDNLQYESRSAESAMEEGSGSIVHSSDLSEFANNMLLDSNHSESVESDGFRASDTESSVLGLDDI